MKNFKEQKYLLVEVAKKKSDVTQNEFVLNGKVYNVDENIVDVIDVISSRHDALYRYGLTGLNKENAGQILLAMLNTNKQHLESDKMYAVASVNDVYGKKFLTSEKYTIVSPITYLSANGIGTIERRNYLASLQQNKNILGLVEYGTKKTFATAKR